MAANDNSHPPWKDLQDRYWQAFSTLSDTASAFTSGTPPSSSGPVPNALGPDMFLKFGEAVLGRLHANDSTQNGLAGAAFDVGQLQHVFADLQKEFVASLQNPVGGLGPVALDDWAKLFGVHPEAPVENESMSPLGWNREHQARLQSGARLLREYQAAANALSACYSALPARIWQLLNARMDDEATTSIDSLRQLYDLWIDCSETAYHEIANTDAYAAKFGRFVDTSTALRSFIQGLFDDQLRVLNVPNRGAFDALLRRHHELAGQVTALQGEINALRAEKSSPPRTRRPAKSKRGKRVAAARKSGSESWNIDELLEAPARSGRAKRSS